MENKNNASGNDETGSAFKRHQKARDTATHARMQEEGRESNSARTTENNLKTDVSEKKTGGGKQSSPGD